MKYHINEQVKEGGRQLRLQKEVGSITQSWAILVIRRKENKLVHFVSEPGSPGLQGFAKTKIHWVNAVNDYFGN